jgi:hypothetical protein
LIIPIRSKLNKIREPRNRNQRLALNYRQGQLLVLRNALALVSEFVQHAVSLNQLCPHSITGNQPNANANFLSLECAFGWLQIHYPQEYTAVTHLIAEDQEEPLPLNWAVIIEEWDNTYWIVWILLLWVLWNQDGDKFETECLNDLYGWQSDWYS